MSEDIKENFAQLQHEYLKLVDELKHVKEHTFSTEEAFNVQSSELMKEKKRVKSLEQQIEHHCQMAKERDLLIETLENDRKKLIMLNTELSSEKILIQEKLKKEKLIKKELEKLKTEKVDLKNAFDKLKEENQKLISELSQKSEECFLSAGTVKDLLLQIKELEGEKEELIALRDILLSEEKEKRTKTWENLEGFMRKSPEWSKFQMNQCTQSEQSLSSSGEKINLNLREEILEVELREKQTKIEQLESLLSRKEEEELARNQTIVELKQKLSNAGLLNYNAKIDLRLDSSAFNDIYRHLLKLLDWPEGHPGECKTLTEVASLSVVVKDGVQATQPSSVRIIETISIASQTDPVKNLSPVLPFKSFQKLQSDQLTSDSDDEVDECLSPVDNGTRKGFPLFTDIKNCNLDMDLYSMSKGSATVEFSRDSGEVSSASDNSRDLNLNSKKFADCNLIGTLNENKNDARGTDEKPQEKKKSIRKIDVESDESKKAETVIQDEETGLNLDGNLNQKDFEHSLEARKNQIPVTNISTPKSGSADSQAPCTFHSSNADSSGEPENGRQTYLVAKSALNGSDSLSNEEIGKKFQDLSFAFKTDSMTIPKRLHLTKRRRDQAESNIENELKVIKAKLKTLQYLCLNSEYANLMADLKKQLDFVLNAVIQLSSSAESYGYTQHEEKLLEFVSIMLQHVENIESSKSDSTNTSDKLKTENSRQAAMVLDSEGNESRLVRRRSVASVVVENNSRRRASIATLPRVGHSTSDKGHNGRGSQWTPSRPTGSIAKKLSFSQASPKPNGSNSSGVEDLGRDSNGCRHRKESRNSESAMRNIEEFPERRPSTIEPELFQELPVADESNTDASESSLHLRQLFESIEEMRRSSNSQEHITAIHCLRWPETGLHFVPFYITWYVVFVLALVFMGGFFTGINGCYTYSCFKCSALWSAVVAFLYFSPRSCRFLLPLLLVFLLALTLAFLWLTEVLLPQLTKEEVDSLFKAFGLEVHYLNGPPPI